MRTFSPLSKNLKPVVIPLCDSTSSLEIPAGLDSPVHYFVCPGDRPNAALLTLSRLFVYGGEMERWNEGRRGSGTNVVQSGMLRKMGKVSQKLD